MCLIGVKETYVQEKKKVTKNFLGQICTTVSGLKFFVIITVSSSCPAGVGIPWNFSKICESQTCLIPHDFPF